MNPRSGAAVQEGKRATAYYGQSRPEVVGLVPARCRRVLDVGCAAGQLGQALKSKGHEVTGIELAAAVAEQARQHLDHVVTLDVEAEGFPFPAARFDAILFADVLEHMIDPWRVLREAVAVLAADGVVVASIPNLQNLRVISGLVRGRWRYRDRGILDRGHLRFFTLQTIRELFEQAGLELVHVDFHHRRSIGRSMISFLSGGLALPFLARQILVVGRRR